MKRNIFPANPGSTSPIRSAKPLVTKPRARFGNRYIDSAALSQDQPISTDSSSSVDTGLPSSRLVENADAASHSGSGSESESASASEEHEGRKKRKKARQNPGSKRAASIYDAIDKLKIRFQRYIDHPRTKELFKGMAIVLVTKTQDSSSTVLATPDLKLDEQLSEASMHSSMREGDNPTILDALSDVERTLRSCVPEDPVDSTAKKHKKKKGHVNYNDYEWKRLDEAKLDRDEFLVVRSRQFRKLLNDPDTRGQCRFVLIYRNLTALKRYTYSIHLSECSSEQEMEIRRVVQPFARLLYEEPELNYTFELDVIENNKKAKEEKKALLVATKAAKAAANAALQAKAGAEQAQIDASEPATAPAQVTAAAR